MSKLNRARALLESVQYFLDFEASGLHPESYPIEVGVSGGARDDYCALIIPDASWTYWDANAQDIHGISRERLYEAGKSIALVTEELNDRFAGKTLWADSGHDAMWMETLFEMSPHTQAFNVGNIYNAIPKYLWGDLHSAMPHALMHRAMADAQQIREGWTKFAQRMLDTGLGSGNSVPFEP